MKSKILITILAFLQPFMVRAVDVTSKIVLLGNPSQARYSTGAWIYARNVWDMQVSSGRIYIGSGNASNYGPAPNAGPVDIWCYNTDTGQFVKEATVNDEQIDKIKFVGGVLTIPGNDPVGSGTEGYYQRVSGSWVARTLTSISHCYDVADVPGRLYVSLGVTNQKPFRYSINGGTSWVNSPVVSEAPGLPYYWANRVYTIFNFNGTTYASGTIDVMETPTGSTGLTVNTHLARVDGGTTLTIMNPTIALAMFPEIPPESYYVRVVRPLIFDNKLVYIGGEPVNDHQWDPRGLFYATDITSASHILLPGNAAPRDILIGENQHCYVLANIQNGSSFIATVSESSDLLNWSEIFRFNTDSFARSFEQYQGNFYFGLGCDDTTITASTGNILFYHPNVAPDNITLSANSVSENLPPATMVGSLNSSDSDTSDTFSYSLVSGTGAEGNSAFYISGNNLLTTTSFDYEIQPSYSIRVRTTDNGLPPLSFEKSFTINVIDLNEAPAVTSFTKMLDLNSNFTFSGADFSGAFTDPDQGNSIQLVKILSLPNHGTLKLGTAAVLPNQEISSDSLGNLVYVPDPGFWGEDGFAWNGSDGTLYSAQSAGVVLQVEGIVISVNPTTWNIGSQALGFVGESGTFTLSNNGSVDVDISIKAEDAAGGWLLGGARGVNTFRVESDAGDDGSYELTLQKIDQFLCTLASSAAQTLGFRYSAPTGDTFGGGPAQDFTITFTASQHVP